jgi:hypothetical protein
MMSRKKAYYQGVRMAPYDLLKEFLLALGVVTLLVVLLSAVLSSPDDPPLTIKGVSRAQPQTFVTTVLSELNGSSTISGYGPPYNNGHGSVQNLYFGTSKIDFSPQTLIGVHIAVDTAKDLVLNPLAQAAVTNPKLRAGLDTFNSAGAGHQTTWGNAYNTALGKAKTSGTTLSVPKCSCGPLPLMMSSMLRLGQSGAMDGLLLTTPRFFQTDYTRPLLFMADDSAVQDHAKQFNLLGSQWGVMNETGNYPGQAWLWLYTLFYQIAPYNTAWAANTDLLAVASITTLTLFLLFLPWIPGLNRLPQYLKVYRLIWRDHYGERRAGRASSGGSHAASPTSPTDSSA